MEEKVYAEVAFALIGRFWISRLLVIGPDFCMFMRIVNGLGYVSEIEQSMLALIDCCKDSGLQYNFECISD